MPGGLDGGAVLVTGATGFIGRHLVENLRYRNVEVFALTRDVSKIEGYWPDAQLAARCADLSRAESLGDVCSGVDTIFHFAGYAHAEDEGTPDADEQHERVTVLGTRALLDEAVKAGVKCFVFVSSVKAIGEVTDGCVDESVEPRPTTAYGKAKREAERLVLETGKQYGVRACVLRLPLVYGPGVKGNLLRMIEAIEHGRFPPLPETRNQRSMVYVDDVVQAAELAAEVARANGQTYIVTDGHAYSTREIYVLLCKALGKRVPRWSIPAGVLRTTARAGDMISYVQGRPFLFDSGALNKLLGSAWYSCQKIRDELGYRPTRTLADTVDEMVAEYRRQRGRDS